MAAVLRLNLQALKLVSFGVSCSWRAAGHLSQVKPAFPFRLRCSTANVTANVVTANVSARSEEGEEEELSFKLEEELLASSLSPSTEQQQEPTKAPGPWRSRFPLLNPKEKKELRAHAQRLGKEVVVQHVGKWGITPALTKSLSETLEANELVKLKVLQNCPEELQQITQQVEDGLEAQIVGRIGRMLVVYRPSLRKLEAQKQAERRRKPASSYRGRQ